MQRCRLRGAIWALALATVPSAALAGAGDGALFLSTLPSGANVWIDGTYVGRSPLLVDALTRGRHAVTMTKDGWLVQDADVDISAGSTAMASFRMRMAARHRGAARPMGSVSFGGATPQTRVAIDGNRIDAGLGTSLSLPAGTHVAVVSTPAGKTSRTFTVYAGTTTHVLLSDLPSADRPSGIVAPAEEFLPDTAYTVAGKKVIVRYGGHEVVAFLGMDAMRFDGVSVSYDASPSRINGKLYLPFALLMRLTAPKK